ncbi:MAG: amino acid adenylation domain-containing protein [Flavobacteriales bacterium]|nr:amino acid adenylation domain-containing protein [Flavobacteriales bacterium]
MEKFVVEIKKIPVDFDPFKGPAIIRTIPTTEAQREVFVASSMGVDANCAYIESVSLVLNGPLDTAAIDAAIHGLVDRHGSLRSVLDPSGTRMIEFGSVSMDIDHADLSGLSEHERTKALEALAEKDMTSPFDLVNGPVFRVHLTRVSDDEHILRLSGHHALVDGWSLGIMMAETSALYSAALDGEGAELPPAEAFSDYVLASLDHTRTAEHKAVEDHWSRSFAGPIPRLDLPTDRPRPKQKTYKGDRIDLQLNARSVDGLKEVATRNGASFVTTLLTAFEVLLYKLTGDSDVVVGLPAAGQSDLGMKHLVGHCVNLLALRSSIDEDTPFADHLKARRTAVLDAFDNQRYTFGTLLRKLNVPREPGRIPLVPVVFNIDMNMDDGVAFKGLTHRFESNARRFENFELFLNATGNGGSLTLEWSYNTDLFDATTIMAWMDRFNLIVERIIERPAAPISEIIGELPLSETAQAPLASWLGTRTDLPRDRSMSALFEEIVTHHPDRVAIEHVDRKMNYAELQQQVLRITTMLLEAGVEPGDPVGLCVDRCPEMVAAMLAIIRCGAAFVPFDPSYPPDRLKFMFDDTSVKVLLTQKHLRSTLPGHQARTLILEDLTNASPTTVTAKGAWDSAAYIMYTSGSTGRPKGVVVPQRAIIRLVRDQNFLAFGPDLTFLQLSNISFDASTLELWGPLLNGGRLVLQPQQKPTLLEIVETIRAHRVTTVWFTAGLFNLMVDEHIEKLSGLKHLLTGGDVLSVPHVKRAVRSLGPGVLINGYGPTENTTFTCCHIIDDADAIKGSVPIGTPLNNTTVHILSGDLQPVGIGEKGELYAGGDGVALGYWKNPELTAERFVDDPFSGIPGAKLYRTGDIVRWLPDGTVEFIGRSDDQVKVRGFRVELGEIENAMSTYPGVKDRVVMVRNDMPGEKQLVAYVVPRDLARIEKAVDAQEALISGLREHLRNALPAHMVPSAFVILPSFPLNANGKVDKRILPVPELRTQTMHAKHVAPRDHQERALAEIWSELLGVERIGVHDNFFDLGGHSLIGIQLLAEVDRQFKKSLALNALFQAPTIATFSKLIEAGSGAQTFTNLSAVQPKGDRIPFFCVHGDEANHFIPRYLGNDQPFYAFFHQGEDGSPIRYTTVEDIAAHFIAEMKMVRPNGPYLLGGYSFGGIVAYEMACQLKAEGADVPLLVMFDTYAPNAYIDVMRKEQKVHEPLKRMIMRRLVRREQKRGRITTPKLRHFHIIDTYDQAIMAYRPKPFDGPVTVFKAAGSYGAQDMGWGELALGPLDLHVLPGDHYSLIKDPEVKLLVRQLSMCIDLAVSKNAVEAV